jgi:hypothetical protein
MRKRFVAGLVAASALWAAAPLSDAAADPDLAQATETLRLSIDEWKREDAAYRAARGAGKIPRAEQETYAGYVAGLRLRVLEQCEVVRGLGGEAAVAPFECVRTTPEEQRARTSAVVPPAQVLTDEEKKSAVQARLNELEGEIDESLQKRQQEIRQTAAAPRGARSGGGAGGAAGGSGGTGSGSGSATSTTSGTWSNPETKAGGQGASGGDKGSDGTAVSGRAPPQGAAGPTDRQAAARQRPTDGGVDDDIVARQLREAAEKETDPVLKEKLWAEYRKYKEAKK